MRQTIKAALLLLTALAIALCGMAPAPLAQMAHAQEASLDLTDDPGEAEVADEDLFAPANPADMPASDGVVPEDEIDWFVEKSTQQATADGVSSTGDQVFIFPMQRGSRDYGVTQLQTHLRTLGFSTGSADGDYGPATQSAVTKLQTYVNEALTLEAQRTQADYIPIFDVDGVVSEALYQTIANNFPVYKQTLQVGASGEDVTRLQTRLYNLEYCRLNSVDGSFGDATAELVKEFQTKNALNVTGIADEQTQRTLYSQSAVKGELPPLPYSLTVSISKQRVYAYAWDGKGYTNLVRTMKCSTGLKSTPTPLGTYENSTGPGARWHYFKKFNCWAQYAYYIQGDIMFHSVLYRSKSESTLQRSSLNNLGRRASHGCVRLAVKDAKWIWDNCDFYTIVHVVN